MGETNPIRTLRYYSRPSHKGYRNTIKLPEGNNVVPLRSDTIRLVQNGCLFHGLWSEDPNQHLNDFLKLLDSLDLDVANRERTRLLNSVMTSLCSNNIKESLFLKHGLVSRTYSKKSLIMASIFGSKSKSFMTMSIPPQDEPLTNRPVWFPRHSVLHGNPKQAFFDYASSRTDEAGDARLSKFEADFKQQQSEMTNKIDTVLKAITDRVTRALPSDTNDDSRKEEPEVGENTRVGELKVDYFDIFLTMSELAYHKYLMCSPIPLIFLRNPIITEGCPSNLKIPCNIGHVHIEKAYIDLNSPLNIMTRMLYNWIMRRKLDLREDPNSGVSNFTRRIKGMHVFIGNFIYAIDFMIIEDISSIIDPRLSQVVLGKPFVKISNMTHDPPEGVVRFINGNDNIAYKMPHKIEQYNSLSDLEREHTKSVYFRNEDDKRRGVEYVMSKILGFYKECLELRPEYLTGITDEGEVT
ncbi:hypothetical protein Tco_1507936 [Tanacetum coccineum]